MAIDRWSPMGDMLTLRDAMNQLLQDSVVWPGSSAVSGGRTTMPLDVVENPDDYEVYASMPGVKPEDVQITVQGDTLTIRGQTSSSLNQPQGQSQQGQGKQAQSQQGQQGQQGQDIVQSQNQNYLLRERKQATYFRQVTLPTMVSADKATAKFENGELIITLPKAEEAKPKQIRIGGGQPQRTIEAGSSSRSQQQQQSQLHAAPEGGSHQQHQSQQQPQSQQPQSQQPHQSQQQPQHH